MLQYLLDRLGRSRELDGLCLATSGEGSDDPIARFCRQSGVACFRGSLDNVAERLLSAAEDRGWDTFVRISGDSPLLDPALVDRAVRVAREGKWDIVTNVLKRSFPKGQSVEAISVRCLRDTLPELGLEADREHVTPFFYRNASRFRIRNFESGFDWAGIQLSVDTAEDFQRFVDLLGQMDRPHWEYGVADLVGRLKAAA